MTGMIIGIVLGGLAFVVLTVLFVYKCKKRNDNSKENHVSNEHTKKELEKEMSEEKKSET